MSERTQVYGRFVAVSTTVGVWTIFDYGDLENITIVNQKPFLYRYAAEDLAERLNAYAERNPDGVAAVVANIQEKIGRL